jgi:hypothetical protein
MLMAVIATTVLFVQAPAQAQSVSAWDLVHPTKFDWEIRTHRRRIAQDLISRVGLLAAVVPEQSVEQQQQLEQTAAALDALGDGATPRQRSRLYLSRAYQHRRLLDLLANTLAALDCVKTSTDLREEMHCWSQASVLLMDEETMDVALTVLRSARMVPRDEDMPVKAQDPKVWYGEYGRGIVRYIVKPFLQSLAETKLDSQPKPEAKPNTQEASESDDEIV